MKTKIITGDCIEVMKTLPENSVDAIITDPPYGLEFMGKDWDKFDNPQGNLWRKNKEEDFVRLKNPNSESSRGGYAGMLNNPNKYMAGIPFQTFTYNWSKEALRILKPGGYLLSFGGTRTYHRMVCAIEDAGFEIRDCIEWVYGSGFPKSLNIGKAVDKLQGNERKITGTAIRSEGRAFAEGASGFAKGEITLTKGTSEWEGWGTALKPSHEPIVVARKPLSEKTVAENVLKWGTGGINIDGCRVAINPKNDKYDLEQRQISKGKPNENLIKFTNSNIDLKYSIVEQGRFPANLIHDGSDEVRECFPETKSGKSGIRTSDGFNDGIHGKGMGIRAGQENGEYGDSGSASRFFKSCEFTEEDFPAFYYCAKASKGERNEGLNDYITIKLIKQQDIECLWNEENMELARLILKDILGLEVENLSIEESGENILVQFHKDSLFTIRTEINRIIELKTWNLLTQWLTKEYIQDVFLKKEDGLNLVKFVENLKKLMMRTGILQEKVGLVLEDVKNATYQLLLNLSKKEEKDYQENKNFHPTVKSLKLMEYLIKLVSPEGSTVMDCFLGSGTTGVACAKLNRNFIGIEKEPDYVKIAEARLKPYLEQEMLK